MIHSQISEDFEKSHGHQRGLIISVGYVRNTCPHRAFEVYAYLEVSLLSLSTMLTIIGYFRSYDFDSRKTTMLKPIKIRNR
jgi:hypothetical protein